MFRNHGLLDNVEIAQIKEALAKKPYCTAFDLAKKIFNNEQTSEDLFLAEILAHGGCRNFARFIRVFEDYQIKKHHEKLEYELEIIKRKKKK